MGCADSIYVDKMQFSGEYINKRNVWNLGDCLKMFYIMVS